MFGIYLSDFPIDDCPSLDLHEAARTLQSPLLHLGQAVNAELSEKNKTRNGARPLAIPSHFTRENLLRFLRASDMRVGKAKEAIIAHLTFVADTDLDNELEFGGDEKETLVKMYPCKALM